MDILPLDSHTISLLRSGVYLQSFNHALKSLTQVSIQSEPTIISTSIDPQSGFISIDDNGVGIDKRLVHLFGSFDSKSLVSPPNNATSSGLGITSYLSPSQHRILDSLAHLSLLDICSRQADSSHTHQTLFKEGQVLFSAPAKTSRRHNRGTTTTVRNLFYNLPVRRIEETDPTRLQQRLKRLCNESKVVVQSLAIIHPNITFTLRNSSVNHLTSFEHSPGYSDQSFFYKVSKTGSSTSTFGKVFGRQFVQDSIPLDFTIDGFKVNGLFSQKRHASRSSQLIYLDRALINSNSLHKTLANLFGRLVSPDSSTLSAENGFASAKKTSSSKSVTSTVDRYPVYLILLSSDRSPKQQSRSDDHDQFFFDDKQEDLIPQVEEKLNKIMSKIFLHVFPAITASTQEVGTSYSCLLKRDQNKPTRIIHSFNNRNTLDSQWPFTKRARLSNESISFEPQMSHPPKKAEVCAHSERNETERFPSKHIIDDNISCRESNFDSSEFVEEIVYDADKKSTNLKHQIHPSDKENLNLESTRKMSNLTSRFQYKHPCPPKLVRERVQVLTPVINNLYIPDIHQSRLPNLKTKKSRGKQSIGSMNRSSSDRQKLLLRSPEISNCKVSKPSLDLSKLKARFQYKLPTRSSVNQPSNDPKNLIRKERIDENNSHKSVDGSQLLNSSIEPYHQSAELHSIDLSRFSNSSTFTVIGQLDLKFIIVKIHNSCDQQADRDDELIVAFDQHAVHERIRVERFLKDLCTGNFKIKKLINSTNTDNNFVYNQETKKEKGMKENLYENSVPILVDRIEFEGLVIFKEQFERWGIIYEINMNESTQEKTRYPFEDQEQEQEHDEEEFKQIFMIAVPELIWDRVNTEGLELSIKKILKGCLGFFEDRGRDLPSSLRPPVGIIDLDHSDTHGQDSNSGDWFKFVKDCPTVLIDLLNSKACRGSIMFGDELNDSASSKLIVQLSRTHLPFSCAHGRPTCFPLFKLGSTFVSHPESNSQSNSGLNFKSGSLNAKTQTPGNQSNFYPPLNHKNRNRNRNRNQINWKLLL